MKTILLLLALVVVGIIGLGSVYAATWTYTFVSPTNATTLYDINTPINITTNQSFNISCAYEFNGNGTWFTMTNYTENNRTWWNASAKPIPPVGGLHYIVYRCGNRSAVYEYSNTTYGNHYYTLKDATYDIRRPTTILNGTTYSINMSINISMNDTVSNCSYILNEGTPVAMSGSGKINTWNATPFNTTNSAFNTYHNIT